MLAEFKIQHKERTTQRKERKKDVQNMLGAFKGERLKAAETWQAMQKKLVQKRVGLQAAVGVST